MRTTPAPTARASFVETPDGVLPRGARWLTLLTLSLAAACAVPPYDIGYEDFAGTVAGHAEGTPFEDAQVDRLIGTLDSVLGLPETAGSFRRQGGRYLQGFRWALGKGTVTEAQSARIVAHLEGLKEDHPGDRKMIDRQRRLFEILSPGHVARNIVGTDTDGVRFQLEDYRGNIVVLIFSGEWCGPCRAEYPYQREMLERYEGESVVLLGVNSDDELETAREAKEREGLHYRTWWDGNTDGPISTEWDVWAWPSIFVLDWDGVIRFVNKRGDAIIEAVDQLLEEQKGERVDPDFVGGEVFRVRWAASGSGDRSHS